MTTGNPITGLNRKISSPLPRLIQSQDLHDACRVIALEFSAALDDLFKLNGVGALEESVEHK